MDAPFGLFQYDRTLQPDNFLIFASHMKFLSIALSNHTIVVMFTNTIQD